MNSNSSLVKLKKEIDIYDEIRYAFSKLVYDKIIIRYFENSKVLFELYDGTNISKYSIDEAISDIEKRQQKGMHRDYVMGTAVNILETNKKPMSLREIYQSAAFYCSEQQVSSYLYHYSGPTIQKTSSGFRLNK